jgi:nitrite reductase (NAD(P)H)
MFYIATATHLQRTAPWLEELPGGIDYLKKVVINDCLGICAELEDMLQTSHRNYRCEWKEVAYDTDLQKKFQQFANTTDTHNSEHIEYIDVRGQRHPNVYSWPDIPGPALFTKETAPVEGSEEAQGWTWVFAGLAAHYPQFSGGLSVKHGRAELAVFRLPGGLQGTGRWFATQNVCPAKQARTISRGLVGELPDGRVTLADPIYKSTYDLDTGKGISNPALNLSTFAVQVDKDGRVVVRLPEAETLAAAFEKQASDAADAVGFKRPLPPSSPDEDTGMTTTGSAPTSERSTPFSTPRATSKESPSKESPVKDSSRRKSDPLDW